jgi:hypothetical protein
MDIGSLVRYNYSDLFNLVGPKIKTREGPAHLFYTILIKYIFPQRSTSPCKMKFGFLTVVASALLVSLVLGKPSQGLRKNTKVRVDLHYSHMLFSVFWLT